MIQLKPDSGIPRAVLFMMAVVGGLTIANLYYNQPLLEVMKSSLHATEMEANLITVITQVGYAAGLLFIVPMADMYSRRKIIVSCMTAGSIMLLFIALSPHIGIVWLASVVLGCCSVVPQIFIPMAGLFSRPENKSRNMGFVLSGLLSGILAARVISGYLGGWLGWRLVFCMAAVVMVVCLVVTVRMLPQMPATFHGSYSGLMKTVRSIFISHPRIRLNSFRSAMSFGSMMSIWSCMAFHLAGAPFYAGSDQVGMLGLCGVAGAMAASGVGKYVTRMGILRMSVLGNVLQVLAWTVALMWRDCYAGLILSIILVDIGAQCQQLSNQTGCLHEVPEATNRANTIFMTSLFIGGSTGTFCAGLGWNHSGWTGVGCVGIVFTVISFIVSCYEILTNGRRQKP